MSLFFKENEYKEISRPSLRFLKTYFGPLKGLDLGVKRHVSVALNSAIRHAVHCIKLTEEQNKE